MLLSILTLAFFAWDERLQPVGGGGLSNPDFLQGGSGWSATPGALLLPDQGPAVALVTGPSRQIAYISQDVPEPRRFDFLRMSAEVRLENVFARDKDWQRAGIVLRPFDRFDQRLRYWPYVMFLGEGSGDWQRYQKTFPVSKAAGRLTLFLYNAGESGRFLVRGLTLTAVAETDVTRGTRYALIVCWAGLVLSAAAAMFVRTGTWSRWVLLLLGALILASTLAPQPGLIYLVGDSANRAFGVVDATVARLSPEQPPAVPRSLPRELSGQTATPQDQPSPTDDRRPSDRDGTMAPSTPSHDESPAAARQGVASAAGEGDIRAEPRRPPPTAVLRQWLDSVLYEGRPILGLDKQVIAHLGAFALFAGVLALSVSGIAALPLAGYLLLAAASSEVLQSFVISRDVELADFTVNAIGIFTGMAVGLAVRRWRRVGRVPKASGDGGPRLRPSP